LKSALVSEEAEVLPRLLGTVRKCCSEVNTGTLVVAT